MDPSGARHQGLFTIQPVAWDVPSGRTQTMSIKLTKLMILCRHWKLPGVLGCSISVIVTKLIK